LVINIASAPNGGLSRWKASSLTPISSFPIADAARGVCNDGINFWVTLDLTPGKLLRF
jgi:hypothetical protein